jgi:hypothetical protein
MGHRTICRQAGIARQPFAKQRGLNEARPPDERLYRRPLGKQCQEFRVGDQRHLAVHDGADAAVHPVEMNALQRRGIARNIEGMDLPGAVAAVAVALQEAAKNENAGRRGRACLDDILVPSKRTDFAFDRKDCLAVLVRQIPHPAKMLGQSLTNHANAHSFDATPSSL